jgi:hypothetical protein
MTATTISQNLFTPVTADTIADLYQRFTKTAIAVLLIYRARDPFGNQDHAIDAADLAATLRCSASSVRRAIASLVEAGMIRVGRTHRRLHAYGDGLPLPLKLAAQKCVRTGKTDRARSKMRAPVQNCATAPVEPLPVADPGLAQINKDLDDQIRESGSGELERMEDEPVKPPSDPGYIRWLLDRGRSLPRPPQLLFEWVAKQMSNPLNLAEYKGDSGSAIALLGGTPSLNTQEVAEVAMEKPVSRLYDAPETPPAVHLQRMSAKWNTQKSASQRLAIVEQIAANPDWGLTCTMVTGPQLRWKTEF